LLLLALIATVNIIYLTDPGSRVIDLDRVCLCVSGLKGPLKYLRAYSVSSLFSCENQKLAQYCVFLGNCKGRREQAFMYCYISASALGTTTDFHWS
jgi:hypothetical protein